jgi:hypothetical protein
MALEAFIPFGKVTWTSQSMNTKQLFVPMALIAVCLVGITPASGATISFSENPDEKSNILVATDISGATITTAPEIAFLNVGDVTGPSTLAFRRQMIDPNGVLEGGAPRGVSDVLSLFTFSNAARAVVGFQANLQSDLESGITPPAGGNFPAGVTDLPEDGTLQLLTPANFTVTLPGGGGPVGLAVRVQSDRDVPGPTVGAGLPGFLAGCVGLLGWWRRRRKTA